MSQIFRATIPAILTLAAVGAPRPGTEAAPPPNFVSEMSYFLEGSGEWCALNPAYLPGGTQPEAYTYAFTWDLNRHIVQLRIGGLFADGHTREYWFYVYSWHPIDRHVVLHGYSPDGTIVDGYSELFVNGRSDTYLHSINRFMTEADLLDSIDILGPNLFQSVSSRLTANGYEEQQTLIWTRQVPPERSAVPTQPGTGITK